MQESPTSKRAGEIRPMRYLLIDDDPFALKVLAHQLGQFGQESFVLCESAHTAVQLLEEHFDEIEMIFCDLRMPGFDGIEFIRHLESVQFRGGLILVSGEDARVRQTAEKLSLAYNIDLVGTLEKPIKPAALRRVLAQGLSVREAERRKAQRPTLGPTELRLAIQNRNLVNFYQPKVSLATGELMGVEALVRWKHEKFGIVFPDQFIDMAEDNGLIDDLTGLVMDAAYRQCRAWEDQGLSVRVAVNVSMASFACIDFPESMARMANDAGIELSRVILEVTESQLMRDLRSTLDVFTRLRLNRVGLAIDDFGTGNSSLVQLRDVPFDEMKIDKSFVHGAANDSGLRAILDGTLTMARGLGMQSVAEGVEDISDWRLMRDLGCTMAQGYFVARPMVATEIPKWKSDWEKRWQSSLDG